MTLVPLLALTLLLGALPATAEPASLAPLQRAPGEVVEGSYIVVLQPGTPAAVAVEQAGVRPTHVYRHALDGFAAELNAAQLDAIRRNPNVAWVEEDQVARVAGQPARRGRPSGRSADGADEVGIAATQLNPPWGLDRIDQRYLPLDGSYTYNTTAPGVDVYIVDTGVDPNHSEFGGKVLAGYDAFGGNSWDCNGHGTHVAGIAAGATYGVAKNPWVWSVRAVDCNGAGSYAGIIAATDWVRQNAAAWPDFPPVANYAIGGGYSAALNSAVDNLADSGVFVSVIAGSSNADACNYSPSSAAKVFTTAATNRNDQRHTASNHGPCVDGYAPGIEIPSAWLGGGTRTLSGTSMASAHVVGVGALYKATFGNAPSATVKEWVVRNATTGVVSGNPPGTPNRLLYKSHL